MSMSAIVVYTLFYIGLALLAHAIARQWFRPWGSAFTAILVLCQAPLFLYSGALLPNIWLACFSAIVLLLGCWWIAVSSSEKRHRAKACMAAFGVGVALIGAIAVKESGAILVPLVAALVAIKVWRVPQEGWGALPALFGGVAVGIALDLIVFRIAAGDWYSSLLSLTKPHDIAAFADLQGRSLLPRLRTLALQLGWNTCLLFLVAGVSTLFLLRESMKGAIDWVQAVQWWLVVAFWLLPLVYFTFGSASMRAYVFPVIQQRYFALCIVPGALLAVRRLSALLDHLQTRSLYFPT